ncbi:uncharacterized protein [Nicotiana sylvestris]|uniref:uncharacterized protein n=1 Tax=Nicotiana sylvestris TaxID=4096 RepID=UPI00388CC8C4
MEKNAKAKKILICGLGPDEYNRIYVCSSAKQIWDALQTAHEGTNQVFTSEELISKVLGIIPASWESKITTIQESKELDKISLDKLVGNLKTHEMRKIELRKEEPKKDKALVLKASEDDEFDYDDPDLAMFAKFKRFMKNSKSSSKRETNSKPKRIDKANYNGCYKYGKKILGKGFTKAVKQAFLAPYKDNRSDQEEEKEDEAISLYTVIDEHQAVKTEPPIQLGMHIGRPHLFDELHYDEWKLHMEIFLQATDFDLWVITSHGPILPIKLDSEGNKCNKREEKYDEEDHIWRTLESDFGNENIEVALMGIEESKIEEKVIGMMAMSDLETEDKANQVISSLSCVELDIKELESFKASLEKQAKDLKNQVLELTSENEKKPFPMFDPKYVGISDNNMCTHCGRVRHCRDICPALIHARFRKTFGIAKTMKKEEDPKAKPSKEGVCHLEIGKRADNSISQMYDKGNEVKFNTKVCTVTKLDAGEIVLNGKRHNNVYKLSIMSLPQSEHIYLSLVEDDPLLWHRRLGHASLS